MRLRILDIRLEGDTLIWILQSTADTPMKRVIQTNSIYTVILRAGDDGELLDDFTFHPST